MSVYFYVYLKYDKKAEEHTLQAESNVHTKAGNTVEIFLPSEAVPAFKV